MWKYSELVFKWLPESEWKWWLCEDLKVVIDYLQTQGISILKVGEENYKSPSGVIFTDKPFEPNDVLDELPKPHILSASKIGKGIVCNKHFAIVTFEEGLK